MKNCTKLVKYVYLQGIRRIESGSLHFHKKEIFVEKITNVFNKSLLRYFTLNFAK